MYTHMKLNHFVVHLKLTQHCKSLYTNKNFKKTPRKTKWVCEMVKSMSSNARCGL